LEILNLYTQTLLLSFVLVIHLTLHCYMSFFQRSESNIQEKMGNITCGQPDSLLIFIRGLSPPSSCLIIHEFFYFFLGSVGLGFIYTIFLLAVSFTLPHLSSVVLLCCVILVQSHLIYLSDITGLAGSGWVLVYSCFLQFFYHKVGSSRWMPSSSSLLSLERCYCFTFFLAW